MRKSTIKKSTIILLTCIFFMNCDSDSEAQNTKDNILETCSDGIKNQDEDDIDCGGVCETCTPQDIVLKAGRHKGFWNSAVVNGPTFTDLPVTAIINNGETEGSYVGALFITNNFTSCCGTPGDNGDGEITITIVDKEISFNWNDRIPFCTGEFNGTGILEESNKIQLNLTGTDCDGDHTGTITFFK